MPFYSVKSQKHGALFDFTPVFQDQTEGEAPRTQEPCSWIPFLPLSADNRMNVRVYKPKNMPSAGASVNRTDVRVFAIMIIPFSYIACQQKYRTFFREYVAIYIKLCVDL